MAIQGVPEYAVAVTPSDSTVVDFNLGVYVGVAGNVALIYAGTGSAVTFVGAAAGSIIPGHITKVMSTNTTATSIVGLS